MSAIPPQRCEKNPNTPEGLVVPGKLFIVSAPSGAGKTTLCNALRKKFPDLVYSVSHTTRRPRKGEKEGIDYFFITEAAFKKEIKKCQWVEHAKVYGNYYGTSRALLNRSIQAGRDVLLDIDVQGAKQVIMQYPAAVTIFVLPPSMEVLRSRLTRRGTDSPETINKRLKTARSEIRQKDLYRYVIINDRLDQAVTDLIALVSHHRSRR